MVMVRFELGDGQFSYPNSIAVDMNGFVYVGDDNHRISEVYLGRAVLLPNGEAIVICVMGTAAKILMAR